MPSNPYAAYLEASIFTAEPVELVRMLYRAAFESVCGARTALAAGDILGRSEAISKALEILRELSFSLQHESEPTMAQNLVELYDYMQRRLIEAHTTQSDGPLGEVAGLLANMADAWNKINPGPMNDAGALVEAQPSSRIRTSL
jgi:flagellar protein FliS